MTPQPALFQSLALSFPTEQPCGPSPQVESASSGTDQKPEPLLTAIASFLEAQAGTSGQTLLQKMWLRPSQNGLPCRALSFWHQPGLPVQMVAASEVQ